MRLLSILAFLSLSAVLSGQRQNNSSELKGLEIQVNEHNQAYYEHKIRANETLFSLARFFKIPVADLLLVNNIKKGDTVPMGATVYIPINVDMMQLGPNKDGSNWTPLIYTVRSQETLYRISKMYFPQKMEDLISRNNISSFSLKRGRKLIVGWWGEGEKKDTDDLTLKIKDKIKQKLAEKRKAAESQNPTSDSVSDAIIPADEVKLDSIISEIVDEELDTEELEEEVMEEEVEDPNINYKSGIASWDKSGFDRKNLFVMHNSAKPNSYIRLRYPVTGVEVTAKVLCPIPKNVFADDIDIVISPAVAIALGALDSRFQIQMDYYE